MTDPLLSPLVEDVRQYDHGRYLASLFAPDGKRDALIALLGFNLEVAKVRELTNEPLLGLIRIKPICPGKPGDNGDIGDA